MCNETNANVSIGSIESIRTNKRHRVKYEIAYLDKNGDKRVSWSNWMKEKGRKAGEDIPVASETIPCTFGMCSVLTEVDGEIQKRVYPYVLPLIGLISAAMLLGYLIGKEKES